MSSEIIVNRTPETAGLALERQKLELQVAGADAKAFAEALTSCYELEDEQSQVETAEGARAGQVGKIEEAVPELPSAEMFVEAVRASLVPASPRDPDLKKFKEQVIAAFKHLGLDVTKFF